MLIAVQGDSYDKVLENANSEFLRERARVLLEMERFMSKKKREDPKLFPRFIHILVPAADAEAIKNGTYGGGSDGGEWTGRIKEIKNHITRDITKKTDKIEEMVEAMNAKLEKLLLRDQNERQLRDER